MATRRLILAFLFALFCQIVLMHTAHARQHDFTVFDVRKTLSLHDDDPVYKDFYVNMGTESGVKIGDIVAVYRRVPVIDVYRNKAQGDLVVPIAHLRVIHTQKTMSVCRLAAAVNQKQIPVLQFDAVMMGDRVELADPNPAENLGQTSGSVDADPESVSGTAPRQPATASASGPAQAQMKADNPLPEKKAPPAQAKPKPKAAKPQMKAPVIPAQAFNKTGDTIDDDEEQLDDGENA
jgi:hypothetical protein